MRLPQFSLITLAGIVAFAAVACCSLVYASSAWSASLYTAAIVFLAVATLAAVYRRGPQRAFWAGAAFCGWLYLLLVLGPLPGTQQMVSTTQINIDSELATIHLARWLYGTVLPKLRKPPEATASTGRLTYVGAEGAINLLTLDRDVRLTIRNPSASSSGSSSSSSNYPDEGSFIRVSNALWAWLFALAGGLAGRWLFTCRETDPARKLNHDQPSA
jgi:hypothetical protein